MKLQTPIAILQKQENRPQKSICGRFLSFKILYEFRRSNSGNLMEIPPCGRALTVSYIVEKFVDVCVRIRFHLRRDIVNASFGEILQERHSGISLEGFSNISAVGLQHFRQGTQTQIRVPPSIIFVQPKNYMFPKSVIRMITADRILRCKDSLRHQQTLLQFIPGH